MRKRDTGTNPDSQTDAAREARLRSLFAAADPMGDPSAALTERVTQLSIRRAQPAQRQRPWMQPVFRWCALGLTCAALMGVWATGRRDNGAVAMAIRATASAPALHFHGGGKHERQEVWYVEGVGCYLYGKNTQNETIIVDDMKREYRYEIRERRVTIRHSQFSDPKMRLRFWEVHSGSGILNQARSVLGPRAITVKKIVRNGRTLRQISTPRRVSRITIDPETDRILYTEVDAPMPDGTIDHRRYVHEYPNPKDVDHRFFRFEIPAGVTVIDETKSR